MNDDEFIHRSYFVFDKSRTEFRDWLVAECSKRPRHDPELNYADKDPVVKTYDLDDVFTVVEVDGWSDYFPYKAQCLKDKTYGERWQVNKWTCFHFRIDFNGELLEKTQENALCTDQPDKFLQNHMPRLTFGIEDAARFHFRGV